MKYRLVSIVSVMFGVFLMLVVAAANFIFYVSEIRFETFGAAPIQSLVVEAGDNFELPNPTREGYTFEGWYLEDTFENSANFLVMSNQDRTLYAKWEPNLYTVRFDSNGGSDVDSVTNYYDAEFPAPTQPELEGYTFEGWFKDDRTFEEPFTFGAFPIDLTLYAKWSATLYTVTYQLDGGVLGTGSVNAYTIEDDLVVFPDPTKVGYTFQGWYENSNFTGDVVVAINPNRLENVTLFAKWAVIQYTITFDAAGGTAVSDITQDFGSVITKPADPTKRGHTFLGWLLDGAPFVFNTMPVDGADLVANWEVNSYTVNLNVNGGDPLTTTTLDVDYGTSTNFGVPTRSGYQFNGWSDGSTTWTPGASMTDSNLNLTAQWSIINYQITYVMDRGFNDDANPSTYTVNDVVTLLDPDKEGHTFNGWYTENTFTNRVTQITAGSTGAKTLYAKWTILTFNVTLNVNGGDALPTSSFTYNFAQELNLPTPTRAGFEFTGWETAAGVPFATGSEMPSRNLDLIAQWEIKTYDVVYYVFQADMENPDVIPQTLSYQIGQTVNAGVISNPGYTFNGWFDSTTDQLFTFGFVMTEITEPYILYGKWTPIVYTVTYVLNGPVNDEEAPEDFVVEDIDNSENPVSFTVEDSIPLTEPSKDGYVFTGWSSDSVTVQTVGGAITNVTLTASWRLEEFEISYDADGGNVQFGSATSYTIKDDFALLPATKEGHNFIGWRNQDGNTVTRIDLGSSGDLQLTAVFQIRSYTLSTAQYLGASPTSTTKQYGADLGLTDPVRRGYSFGGWEDSTSGTRYNSDSTMPGSNLSLVGQWDLNEYTINYDLNEGASNASFTYNFTVLQSISIPSPTRTGWTFIGWDNADDGTANHTPVSGTTTIAIGVYAEDLNLKAVWSQRVYTLTYNSAGGNNISSKTFNFGQSLDNTYFPVPTKSGETFTGWFDSANRRWAVGSAFENIGPDGNLALTARWATFPYSITFDADNGEDSYSTSVYPGQPVYIGFTPYKEGYRFGGWMDLDDGTYYTKDSIMPNKSLTLTAQWIEL
jgi:uncharacterized repeat protein (TIGR02543 family)